MITPADLLIVFNLIILEALLSVDNAAVLATMVKDLPGKQKQRALRYGLWGAYFFRGLCLLIATWLIQILWLKIVGGLYLLWLAIGHFSKKIETIDDKVEHAAADRHHSALYRFMRDKLHIPIFWSTVIMVELVDLVFSIDNVFAAVALSDKFWVIMLGVAIGILAMRLVAGYFVNLMDKYPTLSTSAYIVIGLLGLKLILSGLVHYVGAIRHWEEWLDSHAMDLVFSGAMVLIFLLPLMIKRKSPDMAS
ncbi:MAG TPA: DUF475 domain-containing protein [Chitinophagales bacterium]|nr:DUF475 domain-containing protein [Chitinophagales bacterium]